MRQNVNQTLDPQKTSPKRASYGVSFANIWENGPRYNGTALYFV